MTQGLNDPLIWSHPDGRRITIYRDRKRREGYGFSRDAWPTLYRSDVPALDEKAWYASPGVGWRKEESS